MPEIQSPYHSPHRCPRVCLACYGARLASLLEMASTLRLYSIYGEAVVEQGVLEMPTQGLVDLAPLLARAGVALLACGGATCCCLKHFARHGVAVAPWIVGVVSVVLSAPGQNRTIFSKSPDNP
ncbi:hypothetical protein GTA51_01720 [Desulfovibrio aerotolerans]|uniref:Uncharacterized protein n=1 Tax=Solidesulfovibrio aerotolerans TaxID=295255 RepID=A0A7C9MTI4_9BACT|nr:hypothetical protein [Solidesulfovibrio aerotolerans]MYL81854.1 hypothetical protein [Solidesulfovibrio aerotolerans]